MQVSFCKILIRFLAFFTLTLLVTTTLRPQGGTGELSGLVTDASGDAIANASITLINTATGVKRVATTTVSHDFGQIVGKPEIMPIVDVTSPFHSLRVNECKPGCNNCARA